MAKSNSKPVQRKAVQQSGNNGLLFGGIVAIVVVALLAVILLTNNGGSKPTPANPAISSNPPSPTAISQVQQPPTPTQPQGNNGVPTLDPNKPPNGGVNLGAEEDCSVNPEYGQTPVSRAPGGKIAATVSGEPIPMDLYLAYTQSQDDAYISQFNINLGCGVGRRMVEVLHEDALEDLITNEIGIQQGVKEGIKPDASKIDQQLAQQKAAVEQKMGAGGWPKFLAQQGFTEADFRKNLEKANLLGKVGAVHGIAPQNETLLDTAHILFSDQATANKVYQQLQSGSDFGAMARQYSIDKLTKENGGKIGTVNPDGIDKLTGDLIRNLKDGEVSQPFQSRQGWEVVKVLGRKLNPIDPASVQEQAKSNFRQWVDSVRPNYKIEYFVTFQPTVTPNAKYLFSTPTSDPQAGTPRGLTGMGGLPQGLPSAEATP